MALAQAPLPAPALTWARQAELPQGRDPFRTTLLLPRQARHVQLPPWAGNSNESEPAKRGLHTGSSRSWLGLSAVGHQARCCLPASSACAPSREDADSLTEAPDSGRTWVLLQRANHHVQFLQRHFSGGSAVLPGWEVGLKNSTIKVGFGTQLQKTVQSATYRGGHFIPERGGHKGESGRTWKKKGGGRREGRGGRGPSSPVLFLCMAGGKVGVGFPPTCMSGGRENSLDTGVLTRRMAGAAASRPLPHMPRMSALGLRHGRSQEGGWGWGHFLIASSEQSVWGRAGDGEERRRYQRPENPVHCQMPTLGRTPCKEDLPAS